MQSNRATIVSLDQYRAHLLAHADPDPLRPIQNGYSGERFVTQQPSSKLAKAIWTALAIYYVGVCYLIAWGLGLFR